MRKIYKPAVSLLMLCILLLSADSAYPYPDVEFTQFMYIILIFAVRDISCTWFCKKAICG